MFLNPFPPESTGEAETLTARLLGCQEQLIQSVTQLSPIVEFLEAAGEGFLPASETRVKQSEIRTVGKAGGGGCLSAGQGPMVRFAP